LKWVKGKGIICTNRTFNKAIRKIKPLVTGVEELDQEKLTILLTNKYQSLEDAKEVLGEVKNISSLFIEFQKHLYHQEVV
jgi:hypothetical protein